MLGWGWHSEKSLLAPKPKRFLAIIHFLEPKLFLEPNLIFIFKLFWSQKMYWNKKKAAKYILDQTFFLRQNVLDHEIFQIKKFPKLFWAP